MYGEPRRSCPRNNYANNRQVLESQQKEKIAFWFNLFFLDGLGVRATLFYAAVYRVACHCGHSAQSPCHRCCAAFLPTYHPASDGFLHSDHGDGHPVHWIFDSLHKSDAELYRYESGKGTNVPSAFLLIGYAVDQDGACFSLFHNAAAQ